MKINEISNNIKDLRYENNNMSQQRLADLVGCSRQTINSLEKNKYSPSFLLVKKIALVFNVNVDDVIVIALSQPDDPTTV